MSHLRRMFAVVALALVVAPLLASAPLFDPDEGLHAAIAQEMVQRGDYVTPTFRGEPFLDKPILFFWAEAASLRLFGHNEAAVRIPPLLFGLLGMIGVALLGRALFDEPAGLIAGIVYGTMLLPMGVSEVAVHDVGLVPFMCVAALCLVRLASPPTSDTTTPGASATTSPVASATPSPVASATPTPVASAFPGLSERERVEGRRKLLIYGVIAGVALGLSILTKGLVGVVFTGIFGVCLAVYRPSAVIRLAVVLTIAVIVAVFVAAPWYVAMEHAHPGYLHYYFVERHLQGYLTASQRHSGRAFWYYVPIVLGGALPWTGYLAGALRFAWPAGAERGRMRMILWGWFAIGLVFLSIGESKLVTYALPLFPALAIIIGEYLSSSFSRSEPLLKSGSFRLPWPERATASRRQAEDSLFKFGFAVHVMTLALLPALGLLLLQWKFNAIHPYLWMSLVIFTLLAIDAARRATRSSSEYGFMAGIVRMTLYTIVAMMIVAPRAAAWMTSRDLAATLNSAGTLPPRVWVLDERIGSLIFYLDPPLRAQATEDRVDSASFSEVMARMRVDPPDAVIAVRNSQLPRFNRLFPSPPAPDARAGTFTLFRADTLRTAMGAR
jgi:4-amino-4-deoxy-L-arabinose transferase-like glycosyltransferase